VDIANSVLHGSPPALTGSPAIAAFNRIIHTALAREPRERYQNAETMAADVHGALASGGVQARVKAQPLRRLIVLPFRVLRPSDEIQFLAFSLPEAITVSLAGLRKLRKRSTLSAGMLC
jgi:hypothetical protein